MIEEILANGIECSEQEIEQLHSASGKTLIELLVDLVIRQVASSANGLNGN